MTHKDERVLSVAELARVESEGALYIRAVGGRVDVGGWPTQGFSQSSGIPDVWNFWIVYPVGAWILAVATHAWFVYGNKRISESEIKREIERQADPAR